MTAVMDCVNLQLMSTPCCAVAADATRGAAGGKTLEERAPLPAHSWPAPAPPPRPASPTTARRRFPPRPEQRGASGSSSVAYMATWTCGVFEYTRMHARASLSPGQQFAIWGAHACDFLGRACTSTTTEHAIARDGPGSCCFRVPAWCSDTACQCQRAMACSASMPATGSVPCNCCFAANRKGYGGPGQHLLSKEPDHGPKN